MSEHKRLETVEGKAGHPALGVLPEIEKEDDLLEIIWTLREDGKLTRDYLVESCRLEGCAKILSDMSETGWVDIKGQAVELLQKADKRPRELVRMHPRTLRLL